MDRWLGSLAPRTGSSTIRSQIGGGYIEHTLLGKQPHMPARAFGKIPDDIVTFGMARNPYSRAVSLATFAPRQGYPGKERRQPLSIEFFEWWVRNGMPHNSVNVNTPFLLSVGSPISDYFRPDEVDFVGRLERYDRAIRVISAITGRTLENKVVGPSQHRPWREYYRAEDVRELVAVKYAADFTEFGYPDTI